MPYMVYSTESINKRSNFVGKDFTYDYPFGLNLDPKGDLHRKILTNILKYAQEAASNYRGYAE